MLVARVSMKKGVEKGLKVEDLDLSLKTASSKIAEADLTAIAKVGEASKFLGPTQPQPTNRSALASTAGMSFQTRSFRVWDQNQTTEVSSADAILASVGVWLLRGV
ncbi:hypothetical protein L596_027318 [Steinernema carpocapsae]|uniref:Uncharacterized protein n=1 Tax=Steinernema carpocapsae TaxID=34508 RepID=A0A4U5M3Y7_STECR|nr:hypothetical protein L596_027318 [Steinernema carpocapsae]